LNRSIHDEELCAERGNRPVGFGAIGDLIAHARSQGEDSAVLELGREFTLEAEKNVSLAAPVVRHIARCVLDQSVVPKAIPLICI
jgi:hypothetical protein